MNRTKVASEMLKLAKVLVSADRPGTRVTRATVKSVLQKMGLTPDQYELDSDTVSFWPSFFDDDFHEGDRIAKKHAYKLAKVLGASVISNGSYYRVQWRGKQVDMGDWDDKSSRWHY